MILNQEELEGIIKGDWAIDCPIMNLIPSHTDIEAYQGAGYIKQGKGHELLFKLISAQKPTFSFKPEITKSGQLYADEEYWRLLARDVHGREWLSERIIPELIHDEGTVATGALHNLTSSTPNDQGEEPSLNLWLLGNFKVTCNQTKIVTTTVDGEEAGLTGERNHGKFSVGQKHFLLRREKDWLFLEVRNPTCTFHPFYAGRIEDSLEFVLGRPARATILLRNDGNLWHLDIRPVPPASHSSHAKPPYPPPIKEKEGHFWNLFGLHLNFVESHASWTRPQLSRIWQYFIDSRSAALEIRALALGVGIEGLLKTLHPVTENQAVPQVEPARSILNAADIEGSIKKRLLGTLDSMTQKSSSDRLHQLMDRGVITRDQFKAWKKIRNKAAHAEDFLVDDATIRDCDLVLTAAHRIVFDVLGYRGLYKDYGSPGWPILTYPVTTPN